MFRVLSLVLVAFNLLLVGGCGGGGGGGGGGGAGAGGSSGGGGTIPRNNFYFNGVIAPSWNVTAAEANVYRTNEYRKIINDVVYDQSLEQIHAAEAYAALDKNGKAAVNGGAGVKIAVIDTGAQITHNEIAPNFNAAGSYNYYNNNNTVNDADGGHGTHVASIAAAAKDGSGIQGVAYDATLVISDVFSDNNANGSTSQVVDALNASSAITDVKVINMSLGYGSYSAYNGTGDGDNNVNVAVINALKVVKSRDVLVTIATGNDADQANNGGADPAYAANPKPSLPALFANNESLAGYVLAVGSVDENSNIADTSNSCGVAKEYCLVAPGVEIIAAYASPSNGATNYYVQNSGTSMAAPMVAGAAAVLRAAWPFLTAPQVANILLTTATHLGTSSVDVPDDVYGWGLLNLYKAVQAQGSNGFVYGTSISDSSYDVRSSSLTTDPIFGDAFTHNVAPALANAVFFDKYGRDYNAALNQRISAKSNASIVSSLNEVLLNNYKTNNLPLSFTSNKSEGISTQLRLQVRTYSNDLAARFSNIDRSVNDSVLTGGNGFSFAQNISQNNRVAFSFNVDELSNSYSNKYNNAGFISVSSIAANPYQSFLGGYSQNLQTAITAQKNFNQLFFEHKLFDKKLKLNFSYQTSYQGSSFVVGKGIKQNQIMDVNFAYAPDEKTNLMMSLGNLSEFNNNFLNSQAVGAFEARGGVKTSYAKIVLNRELFKNFALIASYSEGITQANGNNQGIFRDYQNIHSRSISFGAVADKIFGGKVGLLYSEPLRVYSGSATIDVAVARDADGNIIRYRDNVSLRPQGKQQNLEMVYGFDIGKASQLNFNFMLSKDVGNVQGNDARLGMMIYHIKF